VHKLQ
jgi:hypothetical protein